MSGQKGIPFFVPRHLEKATDTRNSNKFKRPPDLGALVVEEVPAALVGGFFDALLHPFDDSAQRALMDAVFPGQLGIVVTR